MKKLKEGDWVRLIGTPTNAKVINNNCDGTYDLEFQDNMIRKAVPASELADTFKQVLSNNYKRLLELQVYFQLNTKDMTIVINLTVFAVMILGAMLVGWGLSVLIH